MKSMLCSWQRERKWIYHGEVSQRGCWTGRARGCSARPASSSAPARSPPAPRSSGSGSCDWPRVGTCGSWHRAGPRRGWWGTRGTCLGACWPPPSGSRGWRRCPVPGKKGDRGMKPPTCTPPTQGLCFKHKSELEMGKKPLTFRQ